MEIDKLENLLERIALSLERIANIVEHGGYPIIKEPIISSPIEPQLVDEKTSEIQEEIILKNKEVEKKIERFLRLKNIEIKFVPTKDSSDNLINSLAEFLGNHFIALRELLAVIKSKMPKGGRFEICIKDYGQKEISDVCQFCSLLYEAAFLEQYKYFKSPSYLIKAKTTSLPAAQNFFSGKWLERFVLWTIQKSVITVSAEINKELEFFYLLNPQIILPNGNDSELDLIFRINEIIFWIEAKSADYQEHIQKYSKMTKILGLDIKHSIMVLTDIKVDKAKALTSLFSMTIYSLTQLESGLVETIKEDINAQQTL